jgi:hypothetical protein
MHIRSLLVLGGALLLVAANAFAGPKEEVAAATAKWGETLGQDDPLSEDCGTKEEEGSLSPLT